MASPDIGHSPDDKHHGVMVDEEKNYNPTRRVSTVGLVELSHDSTHRTLKSRHIQLIGIGGTIGTALYVQIGQGLMNGGPASLFIAFSLWVSCLAAGDDNLLRIWYWKNKLIPTSVPSS